MTAVSIHAYDMNGESTRSAAGKKCQLSLETGCLALEVSLEKRHAQATILGYLLL